MISLWWEEKESKGFARIVLWKRKNVGNQIIVKKKDRVKNERGFISKPFQSVEKIHWLDVNVIHPRILMLQLKTKVNIETFFESKDFFI